MENLPIFYYFSFFFIFFSGVSLSLAADTISPEGFIKDGGGNTLVSSQGRFELGFFSPGNSKNRYVGIWYKNSNDTVVWVANRDNPIPDTNGVLSISNGSLVLNSTKGIIWSSNVSTNVENPVAQLLDTGNFVLFRDNLSTNSSDSLWQSFDHPTHVLLPDMKLGWSLKTGLDRYLRSWRSAEDPSPGDFTFRLDIDVLPEMVIYKESMKIARTGPWNGAFFGGIPTQPNLLFQAIVVQNQDDYYYSYQSFNSPIVMLLKLNQSGMIQWQVWDDKIDGWNPVYSAPEDLCGHYGHCGTNSICSYNETASCECLEGFFPKSENNQSSGCLRSSQLNCEAGDEFVKVAGIKLPDLVDVFLNESIVFNDCEAECKKNCSCRAYANSNLTQGGTGCLMWFGDIIDLREIPENRGPQDIYVRVPASELVTNSTNPRAKGNNGNRSQIWKIVIPVVISTIVILGLIITYMRRNLKRKGKDLLLFDLGMNQDNDSELTEVKGKGGGKEVELPLFSFASVAAATDNFSFRNKLGEGGFGSVYKGTLQKGDEIAVKRLSKKSGQGWEEFKNEAVLIAKLQHKNLVRVLGCCIEQDEKILIYEYMPNKSLDIVLFDPMQRKLLDLGTRVRIIEGIAQGLLYLHEYSRLRIIHRDLKASNILLDKDMNPKISDFGMARIFGVNELQANTNRIVGTYGYMSPEYALEGIFSIKSDVFSFGVLLLEIITGRKNTGFYQTDSLNLIGYAWDMWANDRGLDLIDPELEGASHKDILLRYINIALLCVQEIAEDRPSMPDVVSMLINASAPLRSPEQPAFSHIRSLPKSKSSVSSAGGYSINEITVTMLEAR